MIRQQICSICFVILPALNYPKRSVCWAAHEKVDVYHLPHYSDPRFDFE